MSKYYSTLSPQAYQSNRTAHNASALRRNKIPVEMHIFPAGDHGLGLGHNNKHADAYPVELQNHVSQWNGLLLNFLKFIGFMNK